MENPLLNQRQIELLLKEARQRLEEEPGNPEILTLIPMISALGDGYAQTLEHIEKTLVSVRSDALMYLLKAHCHLKLKEYDLMKQEYLRYTKVQAKQAYWEEDISTEKINNQEEQEELIVLINAETTIHLQPLLNTIQPNR